LTRPTIYLNYYLGEASFIFSIAFTGVVWGFILDWVENKERVLLADLELMAICILLVSIASDAWQYLLLRFLTGFFTSAIFAYIIILLSVEYQPGERIKTFLHFSALTSFFVGLGSGVAFFMSMIYYWRWIIRFYSLILGFSSLPVLRLNLTVQGAMKQKVGEFIFGEIKSFISNRTNILLSIQGFFGSVPWGLMSVFLPYAVMEKFNCDFASAGLLLSVMIVGYVFSIPPIHYLDRLRMRGKLGIVGLFPAFSIFMQAIIFLAIFSIPSPDKEIHLIPLIKAMSIVEIVETIQKFFGQGSIVTIMVLIVLFSFFSVFAGPIQYFRNLFCYILDTPRSRRFSLHAFPVEA